MTSIYDSLRELVDLSKECDAARAVAASDRFQTKEEYTAEHRFNAAARKIIPALQSLLAQEPVACDAMTYAILNIRSKLFHKFLSQGFWHAHHVDLVWRMDGNDIHEEAGWLKDLWYMPSRISPPPIPRRQERKRRHLS